MLPNSGMTTTGMRPRAHWGTGVRAIHRHTTPAMRPPISAPMKLAPTASETMPATKPGAIPGRSAIANEM